MNLVLGAGPAGLTAAYELLRLGQPSVVLEKDEEVGGLSRTHEYKGYLFDIGGHRFFSSSQLVHRIWQETLGEDFLVRPRLSRIFYRGHFFQYPLVAMDVVAGLGAWEILRCGLSYLGARLRPIRPETSFAAWVQNRFGKRLFEIFFRTYTEKVWGIPCEEISAEWAAQRIKGLDLRTLLANTLSRKRGNVRTLTKSFHYPRRGPGMMWTRMAEKLCQGGVRILTGAGVSRLEWEGDQITAVVAGGERYSARQVISTLALRDLIDFLVPAAPEQVRQAAAKLRYRDFLIVALMIDQRDLFPDNWIYVHDPSVGVGRIQNFNNWSPEMSPHPEVTSLGMEYFCSRGDALWEATDEELIARAGSELEQLGLAARRQIRDATVLRVPRAYPVYDQGYREAMPVLRGFLSRIANLHVAGRNGMHRYNNQDHAMLSGILAARNAAGSHHDIWAVNAEERYLEEVSDEVERELAQIGLHQPPVPEPLGAREKAASS